MERDRARRATRRRFVPIGLLTLGIWGLSGCDRELLNRFVDALVPPHSP